MKKTLPIIIIIAAIAGVIIYSQSRKAPETQVVTQKQEVIQSENTFDGMADETNPGSFVNYGDVDIASLEEKIVLDFSATWCPSCRKFKKDVEKSLADIPSDLTLILIDYDTNKDLRAQYGITSQHTFVQIDNEGNKINMWSGGSTLESLFPNIK